MDMKYKLWEMSWKEAQERFQKTDTAIVPVGTAHAHGPTPIGIDTASVERLADEVGKRTGLITLPAVPYGENDMMKNYPGSITIRLSVLQDFYTDICTSLHRNGIRKVIFLNGHSGNTESLLRAGRSVKGLGMLIAIVGYWDIGARLMRDIFPPQGASMEELAMSLACGGTPDIRRGGYMGEWGENATRKILGDKFRSIGDPPHTFEFKGWPVLIPMDAWDLDVVSPPDITQAELDKLRKRGIEIFERLADYIADFAMEFQKVNVPKFGTNATDASSA
jgi:creatinine amidohydrolase